MCTSVPVHSVRRCTSSLVQLDGMRCKKTISLVSLQDTKYKRVINVCKLIPDKELRRLESKGISRCAFSQKNNCKRITLNMN